MCGKYNPSGKSNATFETFKLKHQGRMPATVASIGNVFEKTDTVKEGKNKGKEVLKHKIPIEFRIRPEDAIWAEPKDPKYDGRKEPISLSFIATTIVTKGSKNFQNSKLYDFLESAGLLKKFDEFAKNREEIPDEEIAQFLKNNVIGLRFEIEVVNINRGDEKESSLVGKVVELLPNDSIGKAAGV